MKDNSSQPIKVKLLDGWVLEWRKTKREGTSYWVIVDYEGIPQYRIVANIKKNGGKKGAELIPIPAHDRERTTPRRPPLKIFKKASFEISKQLKISAIKYITSPSPKSTTFESMVLVECQDSEPLR